MLMINRKRTPKTRKYAKSLQAEARMSGNRLNLTHEIGAWWRRTRTRKSAAATLVEFVSLLWRFLRESTPEQRRRRYGDIDFDWEHRVDTTAATVSARDRFLGLLNSPYQATGPELFRDMMAALHIPFEDFTFIDIGAGKGRALLMAASYPFRRVIGVELLPALEEVARDNVQKHGSARPIELICGDACEFEFPAGPLVVYLFNPLPRLSLERVLTNLEQSLMSAPTAAWILYHSPLEEDVVLRNGRFTRVAATTSYSLFRSE